MVRNVFVAMVVLILAIAGYLVHALAGLGAFRNTAPSFEGQCKVISGKGLTGVEDIVIDHSTAMAYLSATNRRDHDGPRGNIFLLPVHNTDTGPIWTDLTRGIPEDFHPHGIDFHIDEDGTRRLFVVNHRGDAWGTVGHEVLIYRMLETGYLKLEESVREPDLIFNPNDIVALGPREFFVTNLMTPTNSTGRFLNALLNRKSGTIVHFKNGDIKQAEGPLPMSNGIAFDESQHLLYAAQSLSNKIRVWRVTSGGGLLPLRQTEMGIGADNISVDEHGDLYIAAHPNLLQYSKHAQDGATASPSRIVRFASHDTSDALAGAAETIMETDGDPQFGAAEGLSGFSVAAVHQNVILVGTVFEPRIWRCEMDEE